MNDAQKLLARMSSQEQEHLILRLGRYSERESKGLGERLNWRTGNSKELPKGETDGSIVSKAFELVLSGKRKWNPQNDPDFAKYMMDVIDSLLSHLADSLDNRMLQVPPEAGDAKEAAWHGASRKHERTHERSADWMAQTALSPEQNLIEKEREAAEKRALTLLEKSIRGEDELVAIVEAIREGCAQNGEIAKRTGIDIRAVENAKKRLDRRIASVNQQMTNSEYKEFVSEIRRDDNGRK